MQVAFYFLSFPIFPLFSIHICVRFSFLSGIPFPWSSLFSGGDGVNSTVWVNPGEVSDGQRLARLEAIDRDAEGNANLTYFIDDDDERRHLGLDVEPTSGLSCTRDLKVRSLQSDGAELN